MNRIKREKKISFPLLGATKVWWNQCGFKHCTEQKSHQTLSLKQPEHIIDGKLLVSCKFNP